MQLCMCLDIILRRPSVYVQVQLPNGQVIEVDGSGGGSGVEGDIIDVEVRNVR